MKIKSINLFGKTIQIVVALAGLISIRIFQEQLFYDPFVTFYKSNFQHQSLPQFNPFQLFNSLFFRYILNSLFTIWIVYLLFKSASVVKFTSLLLVLFFVVFSSLFFLLLYTDSTPNYFLLFYTRRFLIQPLFLLLFIPAFYYQKIRKK